MFEARVQRLNSRLAKIHSEILSGGFGAGEGGCINITKLVFYISMKDTLKNEWREFPFTAYSDNTFGEPVQDEERL